MSTTEQTSRVYYTCTGSVRGNCDRTHRTLSGAIRCLRDDQRGCASQGGYSDRSVQRIDGKDLSRDEVEWIDSIVNN